MGDIQFDTYYRVDFWGAYLAGPFGAYADAAANPGDVEGWHVVLVTVRGTPVAE